MLRSAERRVNFADVMFRWMMRLLQLDGRREDITGFTMPRRRSTSQPTAADVKRADLCPAALVFTTAEAPE
uniref:Transposase n=1 Tax=Angiostrongylus cantonensis TaxID=6313 RepID=A0A0K0CXC2_ANGCA